MKKLVLIANLLFATHCPGQSLLAPAPSTHSTESPRECPQDAPNGENNAAACDESTDQAMRPRASSNDAAKMDASGRSQKRSLDIPPTELPETEFEHFVRDVVGHPVKNYGSALFIQPPSTFAPLDNVPVPADYAIGPGDELLVRIWGKISLDSRLTVDRNGQIYLPKVGTLSVVGLRYAQLDGYLHTAVAALFKDFELNVTLGQLRSIQVFVLGSARRPGTYTVSSLSTLVDAVFLSGGPSGSGSMRHIRLVRANKSVVDFDMYDLLKTGNKSQDQQLQPGDIVFMPPAGPRTAIVGSVNEPGIYELNGETTVGSVLKVAGGLTSVAEATRVLLERIDDHSHRSVQEFTLDLAGMQRTVKDGDLLQIFPVSPHIADSVMLRGNVAQPGTYAWHQGMRISDLIPTREFILTRVFWDRQNHSASVNDRVPAEDSKAEPSSRKPGEAGTLKTQSDESASLAKPNGQERPPETPATTDILHNDAEINWRYAAIERLDSHDLSTRLIAFNLENAIDTVTSPDNQVLEAGDIITIFSRADIPLPVEEHAAFVRLDGEVSAPGIYRVEPGETLRDAVTQAGGLTTHSYLYASQLLRVSTRHLQEERLKQSADQMQRELASSYATTLQMTGTGADPQGQYSARQALVARLSSIKPTGRVVLEMKPDANSIADIPDFTLEDGDSFYIPPRLSTVQVSGAVYNENAFRYLQKKLTTAYLADAGGATRDADVKRMFLIRADGTIISRQNHGRHNRDTFTKTALLPGDAIIVPVKLSASGGMKQIQELTGILSQAALTAASLSVIQR